MERTRLWPRLLLLLAPLLLGCALSARAGAAPCGTPADRPDGWRSESLAAVGIEPTLACRLADRFGAWAEANLHAVLVARHGALVLEQYFHGSDSEWGRPPAPVAFGPDTPHDLRSITKTVVGLLVGVGVAQGWLHDVDQPVFALLPAYADLRTPEKARITVRDLLTMSAGLAWNEDVPYHDPANSETRMDGAADPCREALGPPMVTPPGAVWTYSGGSTALLACILQIRSGQPLDVLADRFLFQPLGITDATWARYPLTRGPVAASGLRMRPRDTLKIGQLLLDQGAWRGRQLVSRDWVRAMTTPQINGPGTLFYGWQIWSGRSLVERREIDWVAGIGYGGQRLYVMPSLDLVVLVQAGLYESRMQDWIGTLVLNRFVLPAVLRNDGEGNPCCKTGAR